MAVALGRAPLATMLTLGAVAVIYLLGRVERRIGTAAPDEQPHIDVERDRRRLRTAPPGS
jgi:hypothetical protein